MAHVRIFLSTVSDEFRSYRDRLAEKLKRPNLSVHVQEDFIAAGTERLDKVDDYISECEAVVHLVGDMTGAMASPSAVAAIKERYPDFATSFPPLAETLSNGAPPLSYTQWEAFLALYHRKVLIICAPKVTAPRDPTYRKIDAETASQQAHLQRLRSCHRYPEISFANADDLIIEVLRSTLQDIIRQIEQSSTLQNTIRQIESSALRNIPRQVDLSLMREIIELRSKLESIEVLGSLDTLGQVEQYSGLLNIIRQIEQSSTLRYIPRQVELSSNLDPLMSARRTKRVLKLVVASPSDVKPERDAVSDAVKELNDGVARHLGIGIELLRWETDTYPGFHPQGPQGLVDNALQIPNCDILVGIFWKRLGTPVRDAASGTEHEFKLAYEAWKRNARPQIMMYFKERSYTPTNKIETDQWGLVLEFKNNFPTEGFWRPFPSTRKFGEMFRKNLTNFLLERFPAG